MFITGCLECHVPRDELTGTSDLAANCFLKVMYQQDKNNQLKYLFETSPK
jgi:hypothetical protein